MLAGPALVWLKKGTAKPLFKTYRDFVEQARLLDPFARRARLACRAGLLDPCCLFFSI